MRTAFAAALVLILAGTTACSLLDDPARRPKAVVAGQAPAQSLGVFTASRDSFGQVAREFFNIRPTPQQPIPFPHKTHIENGLLCTDYCHENVTKAPIPGLPSVKTCMICHQAIATNSPFIKRITTEYHEKGIDLPWQRVYGFQAQSHVRFNHPPHLRAGVACSKCHGDVETQTVAERVVDHTMGFCVTCHREKKAPNECITCHF